MGRDMTYLYAGGGVQQNVFNRIGTITKKCGNSSNLKVLFQMRLISLVIQIETDIIM